MHFLGSILRGPNNNQNVNGQYKMATSKIPERQQLGTTNIAHLS